MDKMATNGITHIAVMTNSRNKTGGVANAASPPAPAPATEEGRTK
jgi:biopolymer transport protein TolR